MELLKSAEDQVRTQVERNVFLSKPEAREMYALERMWGPDLDEEPAQPG